MPSGSCVIEQIGDALSRYQLAVDTTYDISLSHASLGCRAARQNFFHHHPTFQHGKTVLASILGRKGGDADPQVRSSFRDLNALRRLRPGGYIGFDSGVL